MQRIKDFLDDLGGGRAVSVFVAGIVFIGVAGVEWVAEREETEKSLRERVRALEIEAALQRSFREEGPRFTAKDAAIIENRLSRLEQAQDRLLDSLRNGRHD